jgi:uroporphyrinogen-III synthase
MHILLTRPLEDNREMILKFQSLGHEVTHMPLISIEGIKYEDLNFSDFKGIIFTSSNAIKFLDTKSVDKKINCFCVGSATESKAKSIGFQNIFAADGNVNNLKELILQNFNSSDGKLLYVSGEIISNDLDQILISEGYNIQRIINYKANPVEKFSDTFIEKLKLNMPEIVYVYSQNSAISFLNLIKNYELVNLWMDTNLMCIGEKTSAVLNEIKWKKIFLFNHGEEEFLLYKI